jgi:hypothetical protein
VGGYHGIKPEESYSAADGENPHIPKRPVLEKVAIVPLPIEYEYRFLMEFQLAENEYPQVGLTTAATTPVITSSFFVRFVN